MGVLNLLQVINETRVGFTMFRFSLLLKTDVHCVWLAKGGRKRAKTTIIQLNIHSIRHGTNLTSVELDKVSIFQTTS